MEKPAALQIISRAASKAIKSNRLFAETLQEQYDAVVAAGTLPESIRPAVLAIFTTLGFNVQG